MNNVPDSKDLLLEASQTPHRHFLILLGIPFLVGIILRLGRLGQQIIIDDEIHGLRVALSQTVGEILSRYDGIADHSIPLTALYRVWLDFGHPLSEMVLRAPSVFGGLAALVLVPWYLRREVPRPVLFLLVSLIALSPWFVFYSRFARPYMLVTLTVFLALSMYRRFSATGSWRHGLGYALLGAVSIHLLFLAAPAILAPAMHGLFFDPTSGRLALRRVASRRAWLPLGGVLILTTLLLLPIGDDLWRVTLSHLQPGSSGSVVRPPLSAFAAIFIEGIAALSGSQHGLVAGLFWLAVLRGAWVQRSTDAGFSCFCRFVVLFHLAAMTLTLYLLLPHMFPVAFARYLVLLLPFLYLWAALGMLAPLRGCVSARARRIQWATAGLLMAFWLSTGPFAKVAAAGFQTSFAGSKNLFTKSPVVAGKVSGEAFYLSSVLSEQSIVLESPGDEHDFIMQVYADNQRIHRRRVVITDYPWVDSSRLDFANMIPANSEGILNSDASLLVVHRDLFQEYRERYHREIPRRLSSRAERAKLEALHLVLEMLKVWGPPIYQDDGIIAWDLERRRR